MTTDEPTTLTRVGDGLAVVIDAAMLTRLGITADTPLRVTVARGTLVVTPLNLQGRAALFDAALATMSARYEKTLRRLAE